MKLAAVCSAYFYSLFNLFAGFTITQPNMPGWWYASAHAETFSCHKSSFHKTLKLFIILFAMQHHACCIRVKPKHSRLLHCSDSCMLCTVSFCWPWFCSLKAPELRVALSAHAGFGSHTSIPSSGLSMASLSLKWATWTRPAPWLMGQCSLYMTLCSLSLATSKHSPHASYCCSGETCECRSWPSSCWLWLFCAKYVCAALVVKTSFLCVFCSRGMVGWIVLILVAWIFINWTATYFALSKLNFLKR